jgi:photosystem II stability/assembly factor-like uncharacterized protein
LQNNDDMGIRMMRKLFLSALMIALAVSACAPAAQPASDRPAPAQDSTPQMETALPTVTEVSVPLPGVDELPLIDAPQIQSFWMIDDRNGWALTRETIIRTNDGAVTWYNAAPNDVVFTNGMPSAYFLDAVHAWLIIPSADYAAGTIYITADGGFTWENSPLSFAGGSLYFDDPHSGYALTTLGAGAGSQYVEVLQTDQAGTSWKTMFKHEPGRDASLPGGGRKSGLVFSQPQIAWITGDIPMENYFYVYRSDDGGAIWSQQTGFALPESVGSAFVESLPPFFADANVGVLPVHALSTTGDQQYTIVYATTDGGATWTAGLPLNMRGVHSILSASQIFVWDGGAKLYASADSGSSWTEIATNLNEKGMLLQLQFVNEAVGFALLFNADGSENTLYVTTDGGITWSPYN